MYEWDDQRKCVVDYMGLPISRSEAQSWANMMRRHLKHSAYALVGIHAEVMEQRYPNMAEQQKATVEHMS